MTPQELQDLTRRMGEAAYQTWGGHGVNPLAIGLAALMEMIPAIDGGNCGRFCPFDGGDDIGFTCNLRLGVIATDGLHMKPGPSCPAAKKEAGE